MTQPKIPELGCPPGTFAVGPESSGGPGLPLYQPSNDGGPSPEFGPGGLYSKGIPPGRMEQTLQKMPWLRQVFLAGGSLASQITHPTFTPFEQLYRRLPEQGVHSSNVTPSRPLTIFMGGFRVPPRQTVLIFDFRPDIYRFSGVDPNDFVPFETRRFSGQMGWDVQVDNQRSPNTKFELQPLPAQQEDTPDIRIGATAPASAFAAARANAFAATAGPGTALLPQRPRPYGPRDLPLTLVVPSGSRFVARAIFFRPIVAPIAFFEFDVAGIQMPANLAADMLRAFVPDVSPAERDRV
jgi:hypothetical protein